MLRWKSPYLIDLKEKGLNKFVLTSDLTCLYEKTPYSKRLKANAEVLIRNHPYFKKDIIIRVNSEGFRGPELAKEKTRNEFRIFALGDSITLQDYLPEDKLFLNITEHDLNAFQKKWTVKVINGGNTDFGTKEEIGFLVDRGLQTKPDLVVLDFYLNDSQPPWGFRGQIGIERQAYLVRASLMLTRLCIGIQLYQWGQKVGFEKFSWSNKINKVDWKNKRADFLNLAKAAKYGWGAAWEADSWGVIDEELEKLKKLSMENHFRVLVVIFPVSFQVDADYLENTPQRILSDKVSRLGFDCLDLLPLLRGNKNASLFFDECHLTEAGNDIVGHALANRIKKDQDLTT